MKCPWRLNNNKDYGSFDILKAFRPLSSLPGLRRCFTISSIKFVNLSFSPKIFGLSFIIFILGCSVSPDLPTPEKIGAKERIREITGKKAAQVVDKMHGRSVATDANVIAEYGRDSKDLLFISNYSDQTQAKKAFDLMIEKMAAAKNGPFFHLMPLAGYNHRVYMTLGMGAVHYIYLSGESLLWLQTYQSFGNKLPRELLKLYPI
jgi:hypothetical protein